MRLPLDSTDPNKGNTKKKFLHENDIIDRYVNDNLCIEEHKNS